MNFENEWREVARAQREIIDGQRERIEELKARIDALENEINAVEWMNGCIEKELFECRRKS